MSDDLKQQIKEYLTQNLTLNNIILSDPYQNVNDQIIIQVLLENEVVASTVLYSWADN